MIVHSSTHPSIRSLHLSTPQAPDTGDAVYKLTYTADMDGFQAMGDHLPVPVFLKALFSVPYIGNTQVIMDPVPEAALPEMVDYTPEVTDWPDRFPVSLGQQVGW